MPYYNVVVTCIAGCVIEAANEEEAVEFASYIHSGDTVVDEIDVKGVIEDSEVESYKRHADYISED